MASVQVANKNEIPSGTMRAFPVDGTQVLVANCEGSIYAVSNICTHMGGHLAEGKLDGCVVTCPRHGSGFDVRTGANVAPAKMGLLEISPAALKSYPVTVEGEAVKVTI